MSAGASATKKVKEGEEDREWQSDRAARLDAGVGEDCLRR